MIVRIVCISLLLSSSAYAVYNRTDLLAAAKSGDADAVTSILETSTSAKINSHVDGDTALILAARNGHQLVIFKLVDFDRQGIKFEMRDNNGDTALMNAIKHRHLDCVEILLKEKADPNTRDARGKSALQVAMEQGNPHIVTRLKQYGARE